ncbi:Nitrogen permease regulator 2 domain containing protein [Lactarius tabidus]
MTPVALINFDNVIEPNWDLTMAKVCQYVDGTNHVTRIAHLGGCYITLTCKAISHLLYYQVIMTVDIFPYSNMYTLRKSIQWLAGDGHLKEECGPYVIKQGKAIPDWPKLLHLYSCMRPGTTVFEWIQDHDVRSIGIDVHRFASFGVIKPDGTPARLPSIRAKRRPSDEMLAFATVSTHSTGGTISLSPRAVRSARVGPARRAARRQYVRAMQPQHPHRYSRSCRHWQPLRLSTRDSCARPPVLASHPLAYPPALMPLLDGEHHADELCCQFEVGWPTLERWLVAVGGGSGDGDFGKVLNVDHLSVV